MATSIRISPIGVAHDGLLESFQALAQLGARLGGEYGPAAAAIHERLEASPAARLSRRNTAYLELRRRWYLQASNNKAAAEISRDLRRYEAAFRRSDADLTEPTRAMVGTPRELLWCILQASGGRAIGSSRIRQILDAEPIANQQRFQLATNTLRLTDEATRSPRRSHLNAHTPTIESTLSTLRSTPEFQAAAERARAKTVAERQQHIDALAKLNAAAENLIFRQIPGRHRRVAYAVIDVGEACPQKPPRARIL